VVIGEVVLSTGGLVSRRLHRTPMQCVTRLLAGIEHAARTRCAIQSAARSRSRVKMPTGIRLVRRMQLAIVSEGGTRSAAAVAVEITA
jgi:IS4 transposase